MRQCVYAHAKLCASLSVVQVKRWVIDEGAKNAETCTNLEFSDVR